MLKREIHERVALFKLLSDPNRYQCIAFLMRAKEGESVGSIAEELDMIHSSVSHLLSGLYEANVVAYKKQGREVLYSIAKTPQAKRVAKLMKT